MTIRPPKKPNSISSDKLLAAQMPPTEIREAPGVEPAVVIDPVKLVKVWAASADVMREVVAVVEASRDDHAETQEEIRQLRKMCVFVCVVVVLSSTIAAAVSLLATLL